MQIPWSTIRSLVLFFGPIVGPRVYRWFIRLRNDARRAQQLDRRRAAAGQQKQDVVAAADALSLKRALPVLMLLFATAFLWLVSSGLLSAVPSWLVPDWLTVPSNVLLATQSRLQAPTDVIFARLATLRRNAGNAGLGSEEGGSGLTEADEALRLRFHSLDSRLLYLQLGPGVLAECPFCGDASDATSYLFYALTGRAAAWISTLAVIAAGTSPLLIGVSSKSTASSRIAHLRLPASVALLAIAIVDAYLTCSYDRQANARAVRVDALDAFFWTQRAARGWIVGVLLFVLAALVSYLVRFCLLQQSPNGSNGSNGSIGSDGTDPLWWRMLSLLLFGRDADVHGPAVRVATALQQITTARGKLGAGAIVRNTTLRDSVLRTAIANYWSREVAVTRAAMEERETVESVQDALLNRINIERIERDAETYARNIIVTPQDGEGVTVTPTASASTSSPNPQGATSSSVDA